MLLPCIGTFAATSLHPFSPFPFLLHLGEAASWSERLETLAVTSDELELIGVHNLELVVHDLTLLNVVDGIRAVVPVCNRQ